MPTKKTPDAFETHRDAIRAAGFDVTPFRLGQEVGKAYAWNPHDAPACPYTNRISRNLYLAGFNSSRDDTRRTTPRPVKTWLGGDLATEVAAARAKERLA
jgi:hypothetical protein